MVIIICVSLLQIVSAVKNSSGISLNYVSVFPAVALTMDKLINLKAATGNPRDLAVCAITVARVLAAGLEALLTILFSLTIALAVIFCAI